MNTTESPDILNNPTFQMAAKAQEMKGVMRAQIADVLISTKVWGNMTKQERKLCIDYLIGESESEDDLRRRLAEIGTGYVAVNWQNVDAANKTSLEAQMLVRALGGPIANNGAMVIVNTMDDFD